MPVPRVRFTVRRMMIAVGAVAISFGIVYVMETRRARFEAMALAHWDAVTHIDSSFRYYFNDLDGVAKSSIPPIDRWHIEMAHRYQYASRYPFLPVAPDPPEPE